MSECRSRKAGGAENLHFFSIFFIFCVSRQEKWHSMRHDVRRGLQVFSCMQENT
jgi:hypothetical protein